MSMIRLTGESYAGRGGEEVARVWQPLSDRVLAGGHGFDIWSPHLGAITPDAVAAFGNLITKVTERLRAEVESIGAWSRSSRRSPCTAARRTAVSLTADRERVAACACAVCRLSRTSQGHGREDGLRAAAEHRLEQGRGVLPSTDEVRTFLTMLGR